MIYGDISEKKKTHDAFFKRLGKTYGIKEIGTWDCKDKKILLKRGEKNFCALPDEYDSLHSMGFNYLQDKSSCIQCDSRDYVRFADFEIAPQRAYYERKTAADFVGSRKKRLYEQLEKMDTFIEGRKGLILEIDRVGVMGSMGIALGIGSNPIPFPNKKDSREIWHVWINRLDQPNGMPRHIRLQDSDNFFSGYDKKQHDLRGLSPLETGRVWKLFRSLRELINPPASTGDRTWRRRI